MSIYYAPDRGGAAKSGAEQLAQATGSLRDQAIGFVETVSGTSIAIRVDGTRVELAVGGPVFQGDTLVTSSDGAIGVVLADSTTFSMAQEGRMVLDEIIYDPASQEGNISLSILEGVFTFVSGEVAKVDPDALVLKTPVATIGIRGTQLGLALTKGGELTVVLLEEADGFVGEVVLTNSGGVLVLDQIFEGVTLVGLGAMPGEPVLFEGGKIINTFSHALGHLPLSTGTANRYGVEGAKAPPPEELEGIETAAGGEEEVPEGGEEAVPRIKVAGERPEPETILSEELAEPEALEGFSVVGPGSAEEPLTPEPVITEDTVTMPPPDADGMTVPLAGVADQPVLSVGDVAGSEDTAIPLDITAALADTSETLSLTILGIPEGATLSAGYDNGDGSWTLFPADLEGLTVTPPAHSSADFELTVSAIAREAGGDTATTTETARVGVRAAADVPFLDAADIVVAGRGPAGDDVVKGTGTKTVALAVEAALTDTDMSETLAIEVTGLPDCASLSAGTETDGTWTLTPAELEGLTMTLPEGYAEDVQLAVKAVAIDVDIDTGDVDSAVATGAIDITFAGGGRDTFLFRPGEEEGGSDVISDFKAGDQVVFEGSDFGIEDFEITQSGDDAVIAFNGGAIEVTLNDVSANDLASYAITESPEGVVICHEDYEPV